MATVVKVVEQGLAVMPDSSVSTAKIQDESVTLAKLSADSVDSSKIVNDTIVNADINSAAAIDLTKLSDTVVTSSSLGNLLTANQASFETDTTGWAAGSNSTVARVVSPSLMSTGALEITCTGAGSATYATQISPNRSPAVTPGVTYTASVAVKSATVGRSTAVSITWYTSGLDSISSTPAGVAMSSTSGWTTITTTGTAPATAAYGRIILTIYSPGASEIHYLDCAGFWQGTGGDWAMPGKAIPGTQQSATTPSQVSANNMLTVGHTETTTPWVVGSGTLAVTTSDKYGASTSSLQLTTTSSTAGFFYSTVPTASAWEFTAVPGETYTFTAYMKMSSGARVAYVTLYFYTGASATANVYSPYVHISPSGWTRISVTGVAPAGVNAMRPTVTTVGNSTFTPPSAIGDVMLVSGMTLNRGTGGDAASPGAAVVGAMPVEAAYKQQVGNMLPPQAATGTDTFADATGFTTGGTLASTTLEYDRGSRSLQVTSVAAATSLYPGYAQSLLSPVTPGVPYTMYVRVKAGTTTATTATPYMYFYTSTGTAATGSPVTGTAQPINSSSWSTIRHTVIAPANAFVAMPYISWTGTGAGETAYFDSWGLWQGGGGEWAYPGTPIPNLGQYTDESVGRRIFVWDAVNNRYQQIYGDTGWRDITSSIDATHAAANPNAKAYVRRVNNDVHFAYTQNGDTGTTGIQTIWVPPSGFLQSGTTVNTYTQAVTMTSAGTPLTGEYIYATTANVRSAGWTASAHNTRLIYDTVASWPTTLPGTAVGTIPS